MSEFPQSREEAILQATINGDEYTDYPQSRIEELLIELKAVIEAGGGGGGTTNYNLLENKPQINGETLTGDKSSASLGLTALNRFIDAEEMVCADRFDPSQAYEAGTYILYNDGLYKLIGAHEADTEWNPLNAEEVDVISIIQAATAAIDYNQLQNLPTINGHTLEGNLTSEDLGIDNPFTEEQVTALLNLIS